MVFKKPKDPKDPKDPKEPTENIGAKMRQTVSPDAPPEEKKPRHRRTRAEIEAGKKEQDKLTQVANPLFTPMLNLPFDAWADSQGIPELRLQPIEAEKLALPVTQLVEYYLPKMPPIAYAWASLVLISYNLVYPRLKLIQQVRKEHPKDERKESPPDTR